MTEHFSDQADLDETIVQEENLTHPKPRRKDKKNFRLEFKLRTPPTDWLYRAWADWSARGKYETLEQAQQAAETLSRNHFWKRMQFRVVNLKTCEIHPWPMTDPGDSSRTSNP